MLSQTDGQPYANAEHTLQGQTKLDIRVAVDRSLASAPAVRSLPLELSVEPDYR